MKKTRKILCTVLCLLLVLPIGKALIGELADNIVITDATVLNAGASSSAPPQSSGSSKGYTVQFETFGGSEIKMQKLRRGAYAEVPQDPTKEGYTFAGWYMDRRCTNPYDFSEPISKSLLLFAKWIEGENAVIPDTDVENVESSDGVVNNEIILTIGEKTINVFGEEIEMDVSAQLVNDRIMLPARYVAEALGGVVSWDEETETVTITKDDITIVLVVGESTALVNDKEIELDSPSFKENDRTFTPLRFITEQLGATVSWDEETQTVTITKVSL